ncbi:cell wall-active antibiotics response protein LiaF [Paenibacillus campi]|uniref:cell wall-active antibiotics response protein LiaF n=1 Tax=Paenibacillus campi TaxID=3106031 RepID=UPI002AFF70AD|nr:MULTISPECIES: cell wall-active antibiotics response protein LiaF [unclassified Paenibacillus]
MSRKKEALAVVLIGLGLLILLEPFVGFFTIVALVLLLIGVLGLRRGTMRQGYIFLASGIGLLLLDHIMLLFGIVMISLGWFYIRANKAHRGHKHRTQQGFVRTSQHNRDPWMLQSTSSWHVIGDIDYDLSLAMAEEAETVLYFHGIIGDLDFTIPEEYGVEIEAHVLFGQIGFDSDERSSVQRRQGIWNRVEWKSPNYHNSVQQVKLIIFYVAGDLNIRLSA